MQRRPLLWVSFVVALFIARPSLAGGPITSGTTVPGTLTSPTYFESWTFSGTVGERVIIVAVTTSGAVNTNVVLKAPGGTTLINTVADRIDYQLLANGIFTIEITDQGLNDAGTYAIGFTNLTVGPLTEPADLDGGAIESADVTSGSMSGAADIDCFTFSGTNGDRVVMNAVANGGAMNTTIYIYPPAGGPFLTTTAGDRLDVQLTATGTWTMVIEDGGNDQAGSYVTSLLNVTAGPHENVGDPDGEIIVSNEIKTGEFDQGNDFDAFTFNGTVGDRVIVVAPATGVGAHTTQLAVYPPNGGPAEITTPSDRFDIQLQQTGTYTIVVEDGGLNDIGAYLLAVMNVTSGPHTDGVDADGGPIASADVTSGSMSGMGDIDCFTFSGVVGQRVLMNGVVSGGAMNSSLWLYPPGGAPLLTTTNGDRLDVQLTATGTWTMVIEDAFNDQAGNYVVSLLNVTGGPHENVSDPDGELVVSNQIKAGEFQQGNDFDAFTFAGNAGDRVIVIGPATGGGVHSTQIGIYPPNGGQSEITTSSDRFDHQLLQTGTYTIVVEEQSLNDTGTYLLALMNVTSGPHTDGVDADGGPIVSADVVSGTMSGMGDVDCFTFSGVNGQRVLMDAVTTAGSMNTAIFLYPPGGGSLASTTNGDRLDFQLNATGTWTMVIEDMGNDAAGSYTVSHLNVTGGPHENLLDTDGSTIASNEIKTGQFQQGVDFDAFTFSADANRRYVFVALATGGGSHNTQLSVYPPNGGGSMITTPADRFDALITTAGTYTIVVEDAGNNDAGSYTIAMVNVTTGPFTGGGDANGGTVVSNEIRTGTQSGPADIDGYQFQGFNGHRVLISAVATGGAGYNTTIYLYPPNGGTLATQTPGDRLDYQLTADGTWTVLVEDNANDTAGNYTMSFLDVTSGPYTGAPETDGGQLIVGMTENGSAISAADFDGWTFNGVSGQTANIAATTTSGAMNTYISLYPPTGGPAVVSTATDNVSPVLAVSGTYTVVIEDLSQDETGTYSLSVNLSGGPTDIGDDAPPLEVALPPAAPSPFSQSTRLGFELPAGERVRLNVFDVRGVRVRSLVDDIRGAGRHHIDWDGRNDHGAGVASGVYYVQLQAGRETRVRKVVVVR